MAELAERRKDIDIARAFAMMAVVGSQGSQGAA
jgi:hypothetical protein